MNNLEGKNGNVLVIMLFKMDWMKVSFRNIGTSEIPQQAEDTLWSI